MNEENLSAETIRQLLNRSSARIDEGALMRLRAARAKALAHYDARSTAPAFAWAGLGTKNSGHRNHPLYWFAALLLAISLLGSIYYAQHSISRDSSDVDAAILTDDLPLDMYVD